MMTDHTQAQLRPVDRAILEFAVALTRDPAGMKKQHVAALREHGLDDAAIHDVVQVTGLFAYYNRIADGLGIDDEPDWT